MDHEYFQAPTQAGVSNRTISEIMLSPVENLPVTIFPSSAINEFNQQVEEMDRNRERIVVTHQVKSLFWLLYFKLFPQVGWQHRARWWFSFTLPDVQLLRNQKPFAML